MKLKLSSVLSMMYRLNDEKRAVIFLFLFFLSLPPFTHAEVKGHGVEVRLTTPKLAEIEPGKIVTRSFIVSNNTEFEEEFFEELKLPPEWQVIIPLIPFKLKAKEQQVRIVAFLVPITFAAGRYEITYSVRSQRDYGITDSDAFSVVVLPLIKLETLVEDKPEIVIAGEVYTTILRLVNKGNSKISIKLEIKGNPDYPVKIEPYEITLEAGKAQVVRIEVETDEKLNKKINHFLKVRAEVRDLNNNVFSVDQPFSVEIIPRITGESDPYHRLRSQIRFIGVSGNGAKGFQFEFSGSGNLDEEGGKGLIFYSGVLIFKIRAYSGKETNIGSVTMIPF